MYCIKEFAFCEKCGGDSTLNSLDYIRGICSYECTNCYETIKLRIENTFVDKKTVSLFYLRDNGQISYKCGNCGKKIVLNIKNKNIVEIEVVLKNAYEGVCENCTENNETNCAFCNKSISVINKKFFIDKKSFGIFCNKECYLKHIECEYY